MRNPEQFVEGDIFIHEPTRRIVRAEVYDPKTEYVTLADGAAVPARELLDIEEPDYLRKARAEIAMLRRELREATSANVTIDNKQFMCTHALAVQVEGLVKEYLRTNSNIRSLQHRIEGYSRDIDKSNSTCAVQIERIGLLRGVITGALFAVRNELYQGAEQALEAGTKI